ncbi:MAG: hypothetical protein NT030_08230 [Candidatus Saganbacteria bacterium]|nr:hypothetical protein [Candidatus Saganbacteria bacterium]
MKKTIKSIATLVLACFISTSLVGSAWGEEPIKVDMKFYNYDEGKGELKDKIDTVYTDQTFAIAMQVYYGNELIENLQL